MPVVPVISALASLYRILNLPAATWVRFLVWMGIGLVVYGPYGRTRSRLANTRSRLANTRA
jgi:APA family basic amino acid/polyamine antiporter